MRYKGRTISGPAVQVIPILRSEEQGGNIYIKVEGIPDLKPFFDLCPQPQPPVMTVRGGGKKADIEDDSFKIAVRQWGKKKADWLAINSLRATAELEWDTVKFDDPETWANWETELIAAGFADAELMRIIIAIAEVNGLNESMLEEARKSFLATQQVDRNGSSSQKEGQKDTPFGELANALK